MNALAIVLAVVIPIAYIYAGAAIAGYVRRTTKVSSPDEIIVSAVLIGMLWPLAFPFYLSIHKAGRD